MRSLVSILLLTLIPFGMLQAQEERLVLISTTLGDIKVKLYNETPKHRDNFLKLAEEGFYDSTIFHRVIDKFMVQGGDPNSRNAQPGAQYGNGGPGYTIPAEFNATFFHKKGALAAARQGDNVNPQKESSGSQFYIVTGQVFSLEQLAQFEQQRKGQRKQQLFGQWLQRPENSAFKERYLQIQQARDQAAFDVFVQEVLPILEAELASENFGYSEAQKQAYSTIGGSPHLDGDYTVFGEVVEGMDVLDKLGNVKTAPGDRPLEDVVMTVKVL